MYSVRRLLTFQRSFIRAMSLALMVEAAGTSEKQVNFYLLWALRSYTFGIKTIISLNSAPKPFLWHCQANDEFKICKRIQSKITQVTYATTDYLPKLSQWNTWPENVRCKLETWPLRRAYAMFWSEMRAYQQSAVEHV